MSRADIAALREQYTRQSSQAHWGEAAAVAVLLGFTPIAGDDRLARHASPDGIAWEAVLADKTWSSTERFLIATAAALWGGRRTMADISQVTRLDDDFFRTWLDMVNAAMEGHVPGRAQGEGGVPS